MFPLRVGGLARAVRGLVFNRGLFCVVGFLSALLAPVVLNAQEQTAQKALLSSVRIYGVNVTSNKTTDGTGVVVDKGGLVLTCYHLVDGMDEIYILAHDTMATVQYPAKVVRVDKSMDLALLQAQGTINPQDLIPATFADYHPKAGVPILAVGNPLEFARSVSSGIVSVSGIEKGVEYIFIDAKIRKGSSGGPVFDMDAKLVGMVIKAHADYAFGECVTVNEMNRFIHNDKPQGDLEIVTRTVEAGLDSFGTPKALQVIKSSVDALVKPGDIILTCDDYPLQDPDDLVRIVRRKPVGSTCELSVLRNGEFMILKPTVKGTTNL